MYQHEKIDYVEFPTSDMHATKAFFEEVFGWDFQDAGPDYLAFENQGVDGGFYRSDLKVSRDTGSALVVFYSRDLESTQSKIVAAKGTVIQPASYFPGGRRFHFCDPTGNEYAVWSDRDVDGSPCR